MHAFGNSCTGRRARVLLLGVACALHTACASGGARADDPDPWRHLNEPVHNFNEALDRHALEPAARGWEKIAPAPLRRGIGNLFAHLDLPRTLLNDALQGAGRDGARHLGRLLVNSTLGVGGLFDVASRFGLSDDPEDFGQTLGVWGFGPGPYFVTPVLGPSSLRDFFATPLDLALSPTFWVSGEPLVQASRLVDILNTRADALDFIADSRRDALDYYVFLRDAWLQNRARKVRDGAPAPDAGLYDDLYDDFEDEEAEP